MRTRSTPTHSPMRNNRTRISWTVCCWVGVRGCIDLPGLLLFFCLPYCVLTRLLALRCVSALGCVYTVLALIAVDRFACTRVFHCISRNISRLLIRSFQSVIIFDPTWYVTIIRRFVAITQQKLFVFCVCVSEFILFWCVKILFAKHFIYHCRHLKIQYIHC